MKTRILSGLLVLVLSACNLVKLEAGIMPLPAPTDTVVPTETPVPTSTPTATIAPTSTLTPLPTKTPIPTSTPDLVATLARQETQTAQAVLVQFRKDMASYDIPVSDGNMVYQSQEPASLRFSGDQAVYQVVGEDLVGANLIVKVDVSLDAPDGRGGCGIAFRAANDLQKGAQYDFVVRQTTRGPAWAVEYRNHGKLDHYVSGNVTPSDQIALQPGVVDTLVLIAQGKQISTYANGNLLGSYESNQRSKGKLALVGFPESGQAACAFSNLWVWALPENGIYGWVTENGLPAGNIKVNLEKWGGEEFTTIASVRTDAYGLYTFEDAPALVNGQEYQVYFLNKTDNSRLWSWVTNSISEYEANESVHIGDFDIANLELSLPEDRQEISLPYKFQWFSRPSSSKDGYQLYMFDPQDEEVEYYSFPVLKYVTEYTLNQLPSGFSNGKVYFWCVRIVGKDGSFGWSFASNQVIFQDRSSGF